MKNKKITWIPNLRDQSMTLKKKIAMNKINHGHKVLILFPNGEIYKFEDKEIVLINWNCIMTWLDDMRFDVGYEDDGFLYHCKTIMKNELYESHIEIGSKTLRGSNESL